MHIPNIRRKLYREEAPQRRPRAEPGPLPALGELQASSKWMWAICEWPGADGRQPCQHSAPLALAPFVIRWGVDAPSDLMRKRLRCTACGHLGAALQMPSWM